MKTHYFWHVSALWMAMCCSVFTLLKGLCGIFYGNYRWQYLRQTVIIVLTINYFRQVSKVKCREY